MALLADFIIFLAELHLTTDAKCTKIDAKMYAKWCQMVPNGAKQGQTGPHGVKRGQKGPKRAYGAKSGQKGQMGPNEAKWGHMGLIFCMHAYFYEIKKSCLATQALRLKLAELWQYCHFLGYYRPSLKAWSLFLYLSEEFFFYII